MRGTETDLLRQEVSELTELLTDADDWQDLRDAIASKGVSLTGLVLAGFYEDEHENEYGALVDSSGNAYEFVRSSAEGADGFRSWTLVSDPSSLLDSFPAVEVAIAISRGGP